MDDKLVLRSRLRSARSRRSQADLDRLAAPIAHGGVTCADGAETVAAYIGVGREPPTRRLVDDLVHAGHFVLLPIVTPSGLAWGRYEGWEALVRRRGLLEPASQTGAGLETVNLVFAPALAVDRAGNRLGKGSGHYDRALLGRPRHRIVAVVFADEVLDLVPTEAHDVQVGAALTPDGVIAF